MEPKFIVMGAAFVLFLHLLTPSEESRRQESENQLKSISSKIDNGKRLTNSEKQRIDDLMNWCDECNNTLRLCKHSK